MSNNGYLKLIIGPMYAGKSSELLRNIDKYEYLQKNILVINHEFNKRYNSHGVTTHNGHVYNDCIIAKNFKDVITNYNDKFQNAEIIIIEELQFYDDALEYIPHWCDNLKKTVIASGLNGSSNRKPIGHVLELMPHADEIINLTALCYKCCDGTAGIFSKKIINNCDDILVGSTETYKAVCRKHFNENCV